MDAAGAGGARPYTYAVPAALADLEDGEAVLVEFGRRQALGVILGPAVASGGAPVKPIADRVRADGPLLPALTLSLARWVAAHYLAPPAIVIRAMLPPGLLERLELVAERTPGDAPPHAAFDAVDADLLEQLEAGARPARDLAAPDGRAGLLRRLRSLASAGHVTLDWTLLGASAGPRFERWIQPTACGARSRAACSRPASDRQAGRSGRARLAALAELAGVAGRDRRARSSAHGTGRHRSRPSCVVALPRPRRVSDPVGRSRRDPRGFEAGVRRLPTCRRSRPRRSSGRSPRSVSGIRDRCCSTA